MEQDLSLPYQKGKTGKETIQNSNLWHTQIPDLARSILFSVIDHKKVLEKSLYDPQFMRSDFLIQVENTFRIYFINSHFTGRMNDFMVI